MNIQEILEKFPEYKEKDVVVTGYDTLSNISSVDQQRVYSDAFSIFFYCGELLYVDQNRGFGEVSLVDGQLRYSLGETQFAKPKSSYWVITIHEKTHDQHSRYDQEIHGIICALHGKDFVNKRIFTQEIIGNKTQVVTPTFLNPSFRISTDLDTGNIHNVSKFNDLLSGLKKEQQQSIRRSLVWLSESTKTFGPDSFLRIWIAIEIGFTRTENTVKELRNRLAIANEIPNGKVDHYFALGRLYGLRKEIVHRGKNPPIDGSILDLMYYIHRDLLFYKLTGQKLRSGIQFIESRNLDIAKLIDYGNV